MRKVAFCLMLALLLAGAMGGQAQQARKSGKSKCEINIATFNLRMDTPNDGVNAWPNRKEMVKGLIRFHDFDIFGTQEGFKHMLDGIAELDGYAYIGAGREDGKDGGEHSAIFYRKDRFKLLDRGNFWFSETPEIPGLGWDATCCNRICSWGKFEDKTTGRTFFVFNSHYDHIGKVARRESSLLLLSQIKRIAGAGAAVFATGDFNADPESEPIKIIAADGLLLDSYALSQQPPYGTAGTFNNFKLDSDMKTRIDYIWVTKEVAVEQYGVLNDMPYARFPSDHFPVMIRATF
jgi:endonuclease/exonuclease/phosphatase family metal-dependent hydrolase